MKMKDLMGVGQSQEYGIELMIDGARVNIRKRDSATSFTKHELASLVQMLQGCLSNWDKDSLSSASSISDSRNVWDEAFNAMAVLRSAIADMDALLKKDVNRDCGLED